MAGDQHKGNIRRRKEKTIQGLFFIIALASITILGLIVLFLFLEGLPIFGKVSVKDFLFGIYWYPTSEPPDFGIFPLIVASIAVTFISSVISIPLGVLTALYLAESASARARRVTLANTSCAAEPKSQDTGCGPRCASSRKPNLLKCLNGHCR